MPSAPPRRSTRAREKRMPNSSRSSAARAMRVKFQADADLDGRILRGVRRAAPEIDFRTAHDAAFVGLPDPRVLEVAAQDGRVLVSQDRNTMPAHFRAFIREHQSA